ncbi:hypothetical protein D3C81_1833280 [compost metagenome]
MNHYQLAAENQTGCDGQPLLLVLDERQRQCGQIGQISGLSGSKLVPDSLQAGDDELGEFLLIRHTAAINQNQRGTGLLPVPEGMQRNIAAQAKIIIVECFIRRLHGDGVSPV